MTHCMRNEVWVIGISITIIIFVVANKISTNDGNIQRLLKTLIN
jgi:hypothetical protein